MNICVHLKDEQSSKQPKRSGYAKKFCLERILAKLRKILDIISLKAKPPLFCLPSRPAKKSKRSFTYSWEGPQLYNRIATAKAKPKRPQFERKTKRYNSCWEGPQSALNIGSQTFCFSKIVRETRLHYSSYRNVAILENLVLGD